MIKQVHRIFSARFLGALFIIVYAFLGQHLNAQLDSTEFELNALVVPITFMAGGLIVNKESIKTSFQESLRDQYPNFHSTMDDYFQYFPLGIDIITTLVDKKENNLKQLSDIIIGEVGMYITTISLKKIINARRPNGGGLSFPSGHTSQAFTGATLLFHHYKHENIWFASSGFLFASITGGLRVLNNKHWVSDVFFGAGLGILVGTMTYHFNPIGNKNSTEYVSLSVSGGGFSAQLKF